MTHNIIEVLKQNSQLKELWIGDYEIKNQGTASLVSAVSVNNSLSRAYIWLSTKEHQQLKEFHRSTIIGTCIQFYSPNSQNQ